MTDEERPQILRADRPSLVVWSSIWVSRPDATITFDLPVLPDGGTGLEWMLEVEEPTPDDVLIGQMRRRLNQLINANLRFSFGQ